MMNVTELKKDLTMLLKPRNISASYAEMFWQDGMWRVYVVTGGPGVRTSTRVAYLRDVQEAVSRIPVDVAHVFCIGWTGDPTSARRLA